jgi:transposase
VVRRIYPVEFVNDAVALVAAHPKQSLAQTARELGVNAETLRSWVNTAKKAQEAPPDRPDDSDEVRALRKRVAELEVEKDILRKAAAYFAKEMDR